MNCIHPSFKYNGVSFASFEKLIASVAITSKSSADFLKDWFDTNDFIIAKTSGSTGIPKEIRIQKEHMLNSANATGMFFSLKAGTSALLCMSANFIAGKMMWVRALQLGWELDEVLPSGNPLEGLEKEYDFSAMVPLQVGQSIAQIHQIKTLIVGGGVLPAAIAQKLQNKTTKVYATYGMTETVTHIAVKKINHINHDVANNYVVLPNIKIATDKRGCLVIDAPLLAAEKIITNDIVNIIDVHQFEWLGRFDSVINSGGVKLIPEQIEQKLTKVIDKPFLITAAADDKLGEKVVLLIEGMGEDITDKSAILDCLSDVVLERYEYPKEIRYVKALERTPTGKIKRVKQA